MNRDKIIVTSGIFDPLNIKELRFLKKCKQRGDWLVVGLHTDMLLLLKTGVLHQKYDVRREIIQNLKCVDEIFQFNDGDGTVCNLLKVVKFCYPLSDITYITDSDLQNAPETKIRGINFEVLK